MSEDKTSITDFLSFAGIQMPEKRRDQMPTLGQFPYGRRIAFIGTPGAGKTATVAGLVNRAEEKVAELAHTDNPFYCQVLEHGSDIHEDVSKLRDGFFPAKTESYLGFRSSPGLLLEWKKFLPLNVPLMGRLIGRDVGRRQQLWHKMLQLPICDLPGETLSQVIRQVRELQSSRQGALIKQQIQTAINDMRESDGYILMLKADRARGLGVQLDQEKDRDLSRDPDVNLVRMLEDIMRYKSVNSGRPIKGVAVIVTAWDKLKPVADRVGFDLLDPYTGQRDIEKFVSACFKSTYSALVSLRVPNVKYFPCFFETYKDDTGQEKLYPDDIEIRTPLGEYIPRTVNRPHIIMRDINDPSREWWQNVRKISYSEAQFDALLGWLKEFATAN